MGVKLSRPDQTMPSDELSKKRKKRNTAIRSVLSNSTKRKTTLNSNNIDNNNNNNNEDTISRVTNTEAPKQTISGDTNNDDTCLNDPAATITTTKRSIHYDPLKSSSRRSRRSRISSSSSSILNRLSIHDEHAPFYSRSNISSGWTALSNDPFSQIEVNTSTFTEITDHSTISRKSLYPEDTLFSSTTSSSVQRPSSSSFLASSARDIQQQLKMYPSRSYQIIKEAFKKAQLQNDPYDWSQFYTAIDHYATESHDPVALVYLARCLISGLGCTPNIQRGFDLLKSHPSCETNYALGHCYLDGLPATGPHTIQDVDKATAFEYFLSAANDYEPTNESIATTIAEAQCRLARMLFQGEGVEQNSKEGFAYLMKSAENNNMYAQFLVGVHYERGLDIPQDLEKAMHYYQKSAEQGFPDAQAALGNRLIVEENYKEGIQWLEKAVQMGNSRAHLQLGILYDKGIGVEQSNDLSLLHYKAAAENGNHAAQYILGLVYYFGRLGRQKNHKEAIRLVRQAAVSGFPYAQRVLGQFYQQGSLFLSPSSSQSASSADSRLRIKKNEREAVRWYKRAAFGKDIPSMGLLGKCHEHGIGVDIDLEKALAYYAKAAENQNSPYVYYATIDQALLLQRMGRHVEAFRLYSHVLTHAHPIDDRQPIQTAKLSVARYHLSNKIEGIPYNPALALQLLTELAETTNEPHVHYWLGSCYDEGIPGVCEIDRQKAFHHFMIAAESDDVDAIFLVAYMMSNNVIPHKGPTDSFPWYRKAALKGHPMAMHSLGLCYYKGIGIDGPDLDTALEWFDKAAKQDITESMSYMARVYLQLMMMHVEQVETAQQYFAKAVQWLKKAAEKEDAYALRELGKIYLSGKGLKADYTIAFSLLQKASQKNDPEAIAFLGDCFHKGTGTEKNLEIAVEHYLRSASLGYPFAYSATAELYYEIGNFDLAYDYYLLASKEPKIAQSKIGKNAKMMVARLALAYIPGKTQKSGALLEDLIRFNKTITPTDAFEILSELCNQDQFPQAFEPLGYCYLHGHGTVKNITEAIFWFRKAIEELNDSAAYFHLFNIYAHGLGNTLVDIPSALAYLRKSAEQGYTEAQHRMGIIYLQGEFGILPDERTAADWLKLSASKLHAESIWMLSQMAAAIHQDDLKLEYQKSAASLGHVLSMRELGKQYLKQLDIPFLNILMQNEYLDEALKYLHMAADANDTEALIILGKTYANCTKTNIKYSHLQNNLPTPTDINSFCDEDEEVDSRWQSEEDEKALAIQCFERAAALGSIEATVYAAEAWHEQEQYAAALEYFQKAAAQGHVLARFFCARYSIEGFGGMPINPEEGFKELLICANELNCVHAYNTLGQCYENGIGTQKDDQLAYEWYRRAAEMTRDAEAYYRIAQMYAQGRIALPNPAMNKDTEACRIYELATKAAAKGHGPSCYQLGLYYLRGIADPLDNKRILLAPDICLGIEYLRTASDLNIKEAMLTLGLLFLNGDFSVEDQEEGYRRLLRAAELGSSEAQFHLGKFYHHGKDIMIDSEKDDEEYTLIPQDFEKAFDLFCRSAAQRHPTATYYLAFYYHHGVYVPPDIDTALEQYEIAVELFEKYEVVPEERWQAEYNLGSILHKYIDSRARAYELFQAAQAHAPVNFKYLPQIMITRYHLYGWADVPVQAREAAATFIRFAQEKFGYRVYLDVARCYEYGLGIPKDAHQAFYWYGQVLNRENNVNESSVDMSTLFIDEDTEEDESAAMFKLAEFYQKGDVVSRDIEKADRLYCLAAKKGSQDAQEHLSLKLKRTTI